MARYRRAWKQYQSISHGDFWVDSPEGDRLRKEMDDAQLLIAKGPGQLWQSFMDTLPGCRASWDKAASELIDQLT